MSLVRLIYAYEIGRERPLHKAFADLARHYARTTSVVIDPEKGTVTANLQLRDPGEKEGIKSALDTYGFKKYEIT